MNDQGSDPTDREGVCDLIPSESDSDGASSQLYYIRNRVKSIFRMSDRGSEYASQSYQEMLHQRGIQVSMSRKGDCSDNAMIESFWGTLKEEGIGQTIYQTREEAKTALFDYIEVFYNRKRKHSSLGYLSPVVYENQGKEKKT